MRNRLSLPADLYPVEAFFNVLRDEEFLKALISFSEGHGINPEDKTCDLPADMAEDEGGPSERFGFVEFWTYAGNQEVRISFSDFLKYLSEAALVQIAERPDQQAEITERMDLVRKKILQIEQDHLAYIAAS